LQGASRGIDKAKDGALHEKEQRKQKSPCVQAGEKSGLAARNAHFCRGKKQDVVGISIINYSTEEIEEIQIVGVYGMNFDNMPELKWKWGYFGLLGVMAALGLSMLAIFKKRKWL